MLNIEKLKEYEKQGYLFHGSPNKIELLEPKQAFSSYGSDTLVKHGEPSVSATPFVELAIFRSIINDKNAPDDHDSSFGYNSDIGLLFSVSEKTLNQAKGKKGFVHILPLEGFKKFSNTIMEWRSEKEVKPIDIIKVSFEDLPKNIEII